VQSGFNLPTLGAEYIRELRSWLGLGLIGELEKNENLGLMKIGLKYRLRLHQANWAVIPDISRDHTRLFDGVVYGFIFAYKFMALSLPTSSDQSLTITPLATKFIFSSGLVIAAISSCDLPASSA